MLLKRKVTLLEKDKYYKTTQGYIRVDGYDETQEPIGVSIFVSDDHIEISKEIDLTYFTIEGIVEYEITKIQFEEVIYQALIGVPALLLKIAKKNN